MVLSNANDPSLIHREVGEVDLRISKTDLIVFLRLRIEHIDSFRLKISEDDPAIRSDDEGCTAVFVDLTQRAEFIGQDVPHVSSVVLDYRSSPFFVGSNFQEIDLFACLVDLYLIKSDRAGSKGGRCDRTFPGSVGSSFRHGDSCFAW